MERIKYWAERLQVEEYIFPPKTVKGKAAKANRADQLSKGNQQKVQLMAALISEPEFLILDEPLSGLDPVNTDLFKGIIREEIAKNKYLIMSSHQMPTIEEFCTDSTIMNRGQAVLQGNLNEIKMMDLTDTEGRKVQGLGLVVFAGRLWIFDKQVLWYSVQENIYDFSTSDAEVKTSAGYIEFVKNITAIYPYLGSLAVFHNNSSFLIITDFDFLSRKGFERECK